MSSDELMFMSEELDKVKSELKNKNKIIKSLSSELDRVIAHLNLKPSKHSHNIHAYNQAFINKKKKRRNNNVNIDQILNNRKKIKRNPL